MISVELPSDGKGGCGDDFADKAFADWKIFLIEENLLGGDRELEDTDLLESCTVSYLSVPVAYNLTVTHIPCEKTCSKYASWRRNRLE